MGFDVYGLKPKNKKGEYFRNNVWWWHPGLWGLVERLCVPAILTGDEALAGHHNDGQEYPSEKALAIADALSDFLKDKKAVKKWSMTGNHGKPFTPVNSGLAYKEGMKPSRWFSQNNVRQFIVFLRASGGFRVL